MTRTLTRIVASVCLLTTTTLLADEQFDNCLKNYPGEGDKYSACVGQIGNAAISARKNAYEKSVSTSQQDFIQSQKNVPQAGSTAPVTTQVTPQPTYQATPQIQQTPTETTETSTSSDQAATPKPSNAKPTQDKTPRRVQFY